MDLSRIRFYKPGKVGKIDGRGGRKGRLRQRKGKPKGRLVLFEGDRDRDEETKRPSIEDARETRISGGTGLDSATPNEQRDPIYQFYPGTRSRRIFFLSTPSFNLSTTAKADSDQNSVLSSSSSATSTRFPQQNHRHWWHRHPQVPTTPLTPNTPYTPTSTTTTTHQQSNKSHYGSNHTNTTNNNNTSTIKNIFTDSEPRGRRRDRFKTVLRGMVEGLELKLASNTSSRSMERSRPGPKAKSRQQKRQQRQQRRASSSPPEGIAGLWAQPAYGERPRRVKRRGRASGEAGSVLSYGS